MPWGCAVYSIRMIFSIADIEDGAQEDYENPESEAEQGAEDEPINSYPIRTSVSITKVRCPVILDFLGVGLIFFLLFIDDRPWVHQRRHGVPGRALHRGERVVLQGCQYRNRFDGRGRLEATGDLHRASGTCPSFSLSTHANVRVLFFQFDTLDVAVQEEFEKYLQERGVNEHVALFIPEYAEHKEQSVRPPFLQFSTPYIQTAYHRDLFLGVRQVAYERQVFRRYVNQGELAHSLCRHRLLKRH